MISFFVGCTTLIATILFHEMGHLYFLRHFGVRVKSISVGFFGFPIFTDRYGTRWKISPFLLGGYVVPNEEDLKLLIPSQEAVAIAAGPLVNLVMALAIAVVPSEIWPESSFWAHVNFLMFVLNMAPVPPLDGGRILFCGIKAIMGTALTEKIVAVVFPIGLIVVIGAQVWFCAR